MADGIALSQARSFALDTLRTIQRDRDIAAQDLSGRRDRADDIARDAVRFLQEQGLRERVADLRSERGDIALDQDTINTATVGLESLERLGSQLRAVVSILPEAETAAERDQLAAQFDTLRDQFDSIIRDTTFLGRTPIADDGRFETAADLGLGDRAAFNNFNTTQDIDDALAAIDDLVAGVRQSQQDVAQDVAVLQIRDDFNRDLANIAQEGADRLRDDDANAAAARFLAADLRSELALQGQRILSGSDDLLRAIF